MSEERRGERPWLAAYPPGMPAEIDVAGLGTLVDLFADSTRRFADRPAVTCFDATLSYAALGSAARALAAWLLAEAVPGGLAKGDRVAIMMPNVPAYAITLFGVLAAGGTVVNVNPLYTPREVAGQLNDSGARVLFVLEGFAHTVAEALPNLGLDRVVVVRPGDGLGLKGAIVSLVARHVRKAVPPYALPAGLAIPFAAASRRGRALPARSVAVEPDDLAFLQYTGGTTGVSKGAMLTHRNIMANIAQAEVWFEAGDQRDRTMVTALPLYHIFALTCCFFFFMKTGGNCLFITNPRDADTFVRILAKTRFTQMSGVNTLFNLLVNHPRIGSVDFSRLEYAIAGGMATQRAVAAKWKQVTGSTLIEGYGLSETSPTICVNPYRLSEWSGTIGYPVPSTDLSIRDPENRPVPIGEAGEICVRGPQVMKGYWGRPEETAKAMTPDGYFRTGDIAVLQPDGQVRIVDRAKDMILVSGFNVYPNEVEDVLASHPAILECAVVGAPCAETGEMVVAHVVARDPGVTPEAIRAYARAQLTGYKVPRRVVIQKTLPKTNVGKVLRRALRETPPA